MDEIAYGLGHLDSALIGFGCDSAAPEARV